MIEAIHHLNQLAYGREKGLRGGFCLRSQARLCRAHERGCRQAHHREIDCSAAEMTITVPLN